MGFDCGPPDLALVSNMLIGRQALAFIIDIICKLDQHQLSDGISYFDAI